MPDQSAVAVALTATDAPFDNGMAVLWSLDAAIEPSVSPATKPGSPPRRMRVTSALRPDGPVVRGPGRLR